MNNFQHIPQNRIKRKPMISFADQAKVGLSFSCGVGFVCMIFWMILCYLENNDLLGNRKQ